MCAGKNFVAALLERRGIAVLDVDTLGHAALEKQHAAVLRRFGPSVLKPGGGIDRRALGSLVFGRPEELAALERIVHPEAARLTLDWLEQRKADGARVCAINAALLAKTPLAARCAFILLVKAPLATRVLRAIQRDGLPLGEVARRIKSQRDFTRKFLPQNADIVGIWNGGCGLFPAREQRKLEKKIDTVLCQKLQFWPAAQG
jgi:dephospho-CoA kinase